MEEELNKGHEAKEELAHQINRGTLDGLQDDCRNDSNQEPSQLWNGTGSQERCSLVGKP